MGSALRIMIVDDNAEVRAFVRSLLSDLAEEIEDYADGESALANFDKFRPDWTLVDVRMPRMDGFAVTSWIKHHYPEARVIVISQNTNHQVRAMALESGAAAFVPKENLVELRSVIMCPEQPFAGNGELRRTSSKPEQNPETKP